MCASLRVSTGGCVFARQYLILFSAFLSVALSLSPSLSLCSWGGCAEPLTLSRPLSASFPLALQPHLAMDGLRLPPLIEEALDSTGLCCRLCSCFARLSQLCVCVCVVIWDSVLFLAPHYRWNCREEKCRGMTCLLLVLWVWFGGLVSIFIIVWLKRVGCCQLWLCDSLPGKWMTDKADHTVFNVFC